ncbi:MAG: YdcF family protein [Alphaproteobacteria bacterium]
MPLRRLGKTAKIALVVALIAAILWLAGLEWFTRSIHSAAPPDAKPADAVVVLTGGTNRLETGFGLLKQGLGKKLFISGVYKGVEVKELLDKWKKEDHGGLDCCVVLGFEADDTLGNARETAHWMQEEKFTSAYLVTANYHMERALLVFNEVAPDIAITPWPVTPEGLDMENWWRNPSYRSVILREYMKYAVTFVWSVFA